MKNRLYARKLLALICCTALIMTCSFARLISLADNVQSDSLMLHNCDTLPATSSGSTVELDSDLKKEGASSVKVTTAANGGKWLIDFSFSATDISGYDFLAFDIYTENSELFSKTNTGAIVFQMDNKATHKITDTGSYIKKTVTAGQWYSVKIPVSDISAKGIDTKKISRFYFANTKVVTGGQSGQPFWIDNIRAENDVQLDVVVSAIGGTVTPSGTNKVSIGKDLNLTLVPDENHLLEYISINGEKVTDIDEFSEEYCIKNIITNLAVIVKFCEAPDLYYTVTASAGENGSVSPSGEKVVRYGTKLNYKITPNENYFIKSITVNGEDVTTSPEYNTGPVKANTTIEVLFDTYLLSGDEAVIWDCESEPNVVSFDAKASVDKGISSEGKGSLKVETNSTTGKFEIVKSFSHPINASEYDYLRFDVYAQNGEVLAKTHELMYTLDESEQHRIHDFGKYLMYMNNILEPEEWYTVTIPLKEFILTGVDIKNLTRFGICNDQGVWGDQQGQPFWIDNVRVAKALKHEVTATASAHGSISPAGVSKVIDGESITYSFTPDENYMVDYLSVDGKKITSVDRFTTEYELTDVKAPHSVHIQFKESPNVFYDVVSSAGEHGSISPAGNLSVREGERVKYTITPDKGYIIDKILVDGEQVDNAIEFRLSNVVKNTMVEVSFKVPESTDQPGEKTLMLYDCETANGSTLYDATVSLDSKSKTQGNFSLRIDSGANANMRYEVSVDPVDATGYDYLLLDVCGTYTDTFWKTHHLFYGLGGEIISDGQGDVPMYLKRMHIFSDSTAGNGWCTVSIPLSLFKYTNLSSVSTFMFGMDNGRWDGKNSETVWFDNIRFAKSVDFETKSSLLLATGEEKARGVSGGIETVDDIYSEGESAFKITTGSMGESDAWISITPADATQFEYLQFDIYAKNSDFYRHQMYFAIGFDTVDKALVVDAGQWLTEKSPTANEWHTVTIPLSYFEGKSDLSYVKRIRFVSAGHMYQGSMDAEFWLDNFRFSSLKDVNYKAPAIIDDDDDDNSTHEYIYDDDLFAEFEFDYYMTPDNFDVDATSLDDIDYLKTGDESRIAFWVSLFIISALSCAVLSVCFIRQRATDKSHI